MSSCLIWISQQYGNIAQPSLYGLSQWFSRKGLRVYTPLDTLRVTYRFQLPPVLYFPSMSDLVGTGQRLTTYLDISPIWLPSRQYGTTLHMVLANGVQDGEVGRFISPDTRRLCRLRKWCRILCQTRQATFSDGFSKSCHWSYMRYILLPPTVLQLGVHCSGAPTH